MRGIPVPRTGRKMNGRGLNRWRRWNQNHWPAKGRWRHGAEWYEDRCKTDTGRVS